MAEAEAAQCPASTEPVETTDKETEKIMSIMSIPSEARAKIFQLIEQKHVGNLRLVCRKWKLEVDTYYEFKLDIYIHSMEYLNRIYEWRCKDCTIWNLKTTNLEERGLFRLPKYVKKLRIYSPLSSNNLQRLMRDFTNLEHLTISRRAGCPWILNMRDTPELANFIKLTYLCLSSENYLQVPVPKEPGPLSVEAAYNLPLVDCYFPALQHFDIFKRFPKTHSVTVAALILKFLARHARTIKYTDISLQPFSTTWSVLGDDGTNSFQNNARIEQHISLSSADFESLKNIRLRKFSLTTKGSTRDATVWKTILDNQSELHELYFEWLQCDHRNGIRERVAGFPWTHIQIPILSSIVYLTAVELIGLSMIGSSNGRQDGTEILPFDLSIFRRCCNLKNLTLRCQESHGRVEFPVPPVMFEDVEDGEEIFDLLDFPEIDPPESALAINANDIPSSVEKLEISSLRMFTTDIESIFQNCTKLTTLFLKDCGRSGALGVTGRLIPRIAELTKLKFLEILGFNDTNISEEDGRTELERICTLLNFDYAKEDTELYYDDGSSSESAYKKLKPLRTI